MASSSTRLSSSSLQLMRSRARVRHEQSCNPVCPPWPLLCSSSPVLQAVPAVDKTHAEASPHIVLNLGHKFPECDHGVDLASGTLHTGLQAKQVCMPCGRQIRIAEHWNQSRLCGKLLSLVQLVKSCLSLCNRPPSTCDALLISCMQHPPAREAKIIQQLLHLFRADASFRHTQKQDATVSLLHEAKGARATNKMSQPKVSWALKSSCTHTYKAAIGLESSATCEW